MPIILATWEAEIRRIVVQSQTGEIACETLSQKKKRQHKKRAGGVPQVVECLPSKHEFKSQYCQKKKKKEYRLWKQLPFSDKPPHLLVPPL
jgi:hypothetical protein